MGFVVQMLQKYINWSVVQQCLKNMSFEDESNSKPGFRKIPAFSILFIFTYGFSFCVHGANTEWSLALNILANFTSQKQIG
jgi:hypothetical protein